MSAGWLTNKIGGFSFLEYFEDDGRYEMVGVKKASSSLF
jgi:hypothetical protein